jgi:hypothetical protein
MSKNTQLARKPPKPQLAPNMPPPPHQQQPIEEQYLLNCEVSKAKAIENLSDTKHERIEMLSSIQPEDVQRLGLLLSISDDKDLNLGDL